MQRKNNNLRSCKNCGWVHFAVSRKFAQSEVKKFNEYYATLSEENQREYYGNKPATIAIYDRCNSCGGSYKDFEPTPNHQAEALRGSTIGPIIA